MGAGTSGAQVALARAHLAFFGGTDGASFYNDLLYYSPSVSGLLQQTPSSITPDKEGRCRKCRGPCGWVKLADSSPAGGHVGNGPVVIGDAEDEDDSVPGTRFAHTLTAWIGPEGGHLVFGGMNDQMDFNTAHVLALEALH
jgi:hypothetical protein